MTVEVLEQRHYSVRDGGEHTPCVFEALVLSEGLMTDLGARSERFKMVAGRASSVVIGTRQAVGQRVSC